MVEVLIAHFEAAIDQRECSVLTEVTILSSYCFRGRASATRQSALKQDKGRAEELQDLARRSKTEAYQRFLGYLPFAAVLI